MGLGYSMANVAYAQGAEADVSPYIQLENIDPKWLEAIGYKEPAREVEETKKRKYNVATDGSSGFTSKL
jgi:hypothetical protein